jgi:hypothetical protein
MVGLELVIGAVLELDPQEVMVLRRGSAVDLKGGGKSVVAWMSVTSQYPWSYIYTWTYRQQQVWDSA